MSGSMSGDGKRSVAAWPKLPRPSSTLPNPEELSVSICSLRFTRQRTWQQKLITSEVVPKGDITRWSKRHWSLALPAYSNQGALTRLAPGCDVAARH